MSPKGRSRVTPRAAILFLMALVIIGLSVEPARDAWRKRQEAAELEKTLAAERQESRDLNEETARLNTDAYIEQQARQQLGLIKPGEEAFVIVPPKVEKKPVADAKRKPKTEPKKTTQDKTEGPSLWDRVVTFFKAIWE